MKVISLDSATPDEARYLKSDPYFCLVCGKRRLMAGRLECEYDRGYRDIKCLDCDATWVEIFELTAVEFTEPSEDGCWIEDEDEL